MYTLILLSTLDGARVRFGDWAIWQLGNSASGYVWKNTNAKTQTHKHTNTNTQICVCDVLGF
jgi:hypothetical protein